MADPQPAVTTTRLSQGELTGRIADRFVILGCLGRGGMGEVYCARDTQLKRLVAIKKMSGQLRSDPEARERFLREAQRASQLVDRNIAAYYDAFQDDGNLFLVMEYVEGESLRKRLGHPLDSEQFLNIAVQCASGLATAHEHRVLHCDVKPENIMLTPSGQAKLLDFGLAMHFVRPTDPTASVSGLIQTGGTAGYTAPEVLCAHVVDERADIFSLGVVFYEMLAGKQPFHAETSLAMATKILHDDPPPLRRLNPEVPLEMERIILRMLAKDPQHRYSSAAEIVAELRRLRTVNASSRPSFLHITEALAAQPRWRVAVAVTVVFVLGAVLVWNRIHGAGSSGGERPTVAVLPFSVADGDPPTQAFSYGLAETLSAQLNSIADRHALGVVAPSEIRSQHVTTAKEARLAFGANLAFEGTMRRSANLIRVTFALVRPLDQRQLWADTVTAEADDPFALEDRVAQRVLNALELELTAEERAQFGARGTAEPAAYDFYLQGRGYLQDFHKVENVENAIAVFQHALGRDPNYALAYAGLGEAYWGKYLLAHDRQWVTQALAACEKAVTLAPNVAEGHDCIGTVSNGTGNYEQAEEHFRRAADLQPSDDEAHSGLAASFELRGRAVEAERIYLKAISLRPHYWGGYNRLGVFYYKQGRYRDAEEKFTTVTHLEPDNARGYSNLGGVLILEGRYADAIAPLQKATSIRPAADALSNLGTAYFYTQRFAQAADAFAGAAQLDPRDYMIQGNLGDAYYWTPGKRGSAAGAYQKAIELITEESRVNPRDAALLVRLAKYRAMSGDKDGALATLRQALNMKLTSPESLFEVAIVYQQTGDSERAFEWLRKSLEAGFSVATATNDPVFAARHNDPRFRRLVVLLRN